MTITDQSEAYKNFINSIDSEATRENYRHTITYFMRFCKLANYQGLLEIEPGKLEGLIRDYIIHLKVDKKLAPGSIAAYLSSVSHFYEMNDKTINWKKLKKFKSKLRSVVEDRPYTRQQIKKLIDSAASPRDKCIILIMSSAGLRKGALPYLRLKDLQKMAKYNLYKITAYKREQEQYTTFCTSECARYIDEYLDWRQRLGEQLKPDSPLFRLTFDTITQVNRPKKISHYIITKMINRLLENTGLRAKTEQHKRTELMQTHGFRKFFKTTCINAGMNPLYSEYVMGHRSGLTKSYFKPSDMELLEGNDKALGYTAVINDLTINEEHRLAKRVTELQVKNDQIMELERQHKKDLEAVENRFDEMMQMIRQEPRLAKIKTEALRNKKARKIK